MLIASHYKNISKLICLSFIFSHLKLILDASIKNRYRLLLEQPRRFGVDEVQTSERLQCGISSEIMKESERMHAIIQCNHGAFVCLSFAGSVRGVTTTLREGHGPRKGRTKTGSVLNRAGDYLCLSRPQTETEIYTTAVAFCYPKAREGRLRYYREKLSPGLEL